MQKTISTTYDEQEFQTLLIDCFNSCLKHQPQSSASQPEADQLLTIQQAADMLFLTVPTLYSKVSKGELPTMKKGKRLYFSKQQLMEYVKSGRKKSVAEIQAEAENYIKKGKTNK